MPLSPTQSVSFWCEECQWKTGGVIIDGKPVCPKCRGKLLGINFCPKCKIGTALEACPLCHDPIKSDSDPG